MRHALRLVVWLVIATLWAGVARADFAESRDWFDSLTSEERADIQSNLTLLGHYSFLVDGQFGRGTFDALVEFQKTRKVWENGVLSRGDLQALSDKASAVYRDWGMSFVTDNEAKVSLMVPQTLLSVTEPTDNGRSWSSPDGEISLATEHYVAAEKSFKALFLELSTPGGERKVSYSSYNESRFVVTGEDGDKFFYAMFRNAGQESAGYTVTWSRAYGAEGDVISAYLASNFTPLALTTPPEEENKPGSSLVASRGFGAFTLPDDENVIRLNGEISENTAQEFMRALKERPNADTLLLNSPGGYVDIGLIIAREVNRRQMTTIVEAGDGCYSACSYIFFAGAPRVAVGELGVHQISSEVADLVLAQTTLGDVIDALNQYGVQQVVIIRMLQTPPQEMYVFTETELKEWDINRGDTIRVADNDPTTLTPTTPGSAAFVMLAQRTSQTEAQRSLQYAIDRWSGVLGGATPEVASSDGKLYSVGVSARSVESANALCEAIKSAGGSCYVSQL